MKCIPQFLYLEDDNTKIWLIFAGDILVNGGMYPTKIGGICMKTDDVYREWLSLLPLREEPPAPEACRRTYVK